MGNFFTEIERCIRSGVSFDLLWDLPGIEVSEYRDVIRVGEDGAVTSKANSGAVGTTPMRPGGPAPELRISMTASGEADALDLTATARVVEKSAPVYYTLGADTEGVYHNARVAWELYGPSEEDYLFIRPEKLKPRVHVTGDVAEVEITARLKRPGKYRLRAATVDRAGRTTVVWQPFEVTVDGAARRLSLRQ
jgi:hypothetical protein